MQLMRFLSYNLAAFVISSGLGVEGLIKVIVVLALQSTLFPEAHNFLPHIQA